MHQQDRRDVYVRYVLNTAMQRRDSDEIADSRAKTKRKLKRSRRMRSKQLKEEKKTIALRLCDTLDRP